MQPAFEWLIIDDEVAAAVDGGQPVVALEFDRHHPRPASPGQL